MLSFLDYRRRGMAFVFRVSLEFALWSVWGRAYTCHCSRVFILEP